MKFDNSVYAKLRYGRIIYRNIKMNKIFSKSTPKKTKRYQLITALIAVIIILVIIGYFAHQNHNDFEKTIVEQTQKQLLITALSEAQSIEKCFNNTEISAAQMDEMVKHINALERVYVLIIDNDAKIINSPVPNFIGKSVLTLMKGKISDSDWLKLNSILQKMRHGEEGTEILNFFSDSSSPEIVNTLLAFAPVRSGSSRSSIIVAMEYNAIAGPINKNARDNIIFGGFVFSVFFVLVLAFFVHQKKKADELENLYKNLEKQHLELKAAQTRLIQAEKMGIVGKLASSVAHEVKNPLAIIIQGMEYLKEKLRKKDDDVSLILKDLEEAVGKADNVVKGLLDFASLSKLLTKPENLNSIMENSLLLMRNLLDKHRISITKNYEENLPLIEIDKNRIEQVFINLILNAIEAMPDGGNLTITTYTAQPQEDTKWVATRIDDTGPGIPEDILENIFEPFFTTKAAGGGSGMGLATVKNIIEMHGGKINISNRKNGHGASAVVLFNTKRKAVADEQEKNTDYR